MKRNQWNITAIWFILMAGVANAATAVTGAPPLPQTKSEYWTLGIAAVTPIIVTGIKKIVPAIPKIVLPSMTPFIGIALGLGLNWLTAQNLGWIDMAQAGGLAVLVREVFTNAVTKRLQGQTNENTTPPTS